MKKGGVFVDTDVKKDISVCFTGHRRIKDEDVAGIIAKLDVVIERCLSKGYCRFITGGALGFDTLAAKRVIEAKRCDPSVTLSLILPCRDQTKLWTNLVDINEYRNLKDAADEVIYIQNFYDSGCMMKRNRYMVDHSSVCIAYFNGKAGGTVNTVNYANKKGVAVVNLFTEQRPL